MRKISAIFLATLLQGLHGHAQHKWGVPPIELSAGAEQHGVATYYGWRAHGHKTASGERHDKHALVAAHRRLPFHSLVRITSKDTGRSVTVRINDRGPFGRGRIIDMSNAAADSLGMLRAGIAKVRIEVVRLGLGPDLPKPLPLEPDQIVLAPDSSLQALPARKRSLLGRVLPQHQLWEGHIPTHLLQANKELNLPTPQAQVRRGKR